MAHHLTSPSSQTHTALTTAWVSELVADTGQDSLLPSVALCLKEQVEARQQQQSGLSKLLVPIAQQQQHRAICLPYAPAAAPSPMRRTSSTYSTPRIQQFTRCETSALYSSLTSSHTFRAQHYSTAYHTMVMPYCNTIVAGYIRPEKAGHTSQNHSSGSASDVHRRTL